MKVVIDMPKEFESHFKNDKFKDSLERVIYDIEHDSTGDLLSGNYEVETLRMLRDALQISTLLPKGHGRLVDADKIIAKAIECMKYPTNYSFMECVIAKRETCSRSHTS